MAITRLPSASITGTIGLAKFPSGSIIQTVTGKHDSAGGSTTSTSYVECSSSFRPTITPTRANSKIQGYIYTNVLDDINTDSHGQPSSGFKVTYTIDGTETSYYDRTTAFNYGGQDRRSGFKTFIDLTVSSTDQVVFKLFYKKSSGSRGRSYNSFRLSHFILHEIAV